MTEPVSVVIPTYQEAQTIRSVLGGVEAALSRPWELLVVDDSPDQATAGAVRDGWGHDSSVRLIDGPGAGLSAAVLEGVDRAHAPVVAVMDGDHQHPPRSLPVVLAGIDRGADLSIGSRFVQTGGVDADWPLHRRAISAGATALAWGAVPPARRIRDPMSGFFAVRRELVESVREELRPTGYKIGLELLARCPVDEVAEVGYRFQSRAGGGSNLDASEYARFVRHLARLSIPSRRTERPDVTVGQPEGR
jgi:dolichol-phosphate mannosyltransferase